MKRVPTDHCSIERLRREKTNPLKKSWIREFYAFGNTRLLEIRIIRKNCKKWSRKLIFGTTRNFNGDTCRAKSGGYFKKVKAFSRVVFCRMKDSVTKIAKKYRESHF